jgi:hypothetical protein
MASPAVVAPHVNGVAALSRPDSPASSIISSFTTKRKREANDDADSAINGADPSKPLVNGLHTLHDNPSLIRDFFTVLQRYAPCHLSTPTAAAVIYIAIRPHFLSPSSL